MKLNHLYLTQGFLHLMKFMQFLGSDTITGQIIRVTLQLGVLESGIGRNIFSLSYSKYSCLLSDSWIKQHWKFADKYNITNR